MLIGDSFPHFKDADGKPLDAGYIYFGTVGNNPETNPIQVYWDDALTQPAVQPIRTLNGFIVRDGVISNIYVGSQYSITVKNKVGILLYSMLDSSKFDSSYPVAALSAALAASSGSSLVGFIQVATGAVARTVQAKLRDFVNVKDFGAIGDGVSDDTSKIQNAINSLPSTGGTVFIPSGKYKITSTLNIGDGTNVNVSTKNGIKLVGEGIAPYFGNSFGTVLYWSGVVGGTVLSFNGSGDGFGLDRIEIDCALTAANGIVIYSTRLSSFTNFSVREFTGTGISLQIRTGPLASVLFASGNVFQNFISTTSSNANGVKCLAIQGDYANNNDWHRNVFICGQTQVPKASSGTTYAAYFEFTDSNTFMECDFNVFGSGTGFGLFLNAANNNAYPQNNFFYGCSIISTSWYETANLLSDNYFFAFTTKDGEVIPNHPKLHGITDTGAFFGQDIKTLKSGARVILAPPTANRSWEILANADDSNDYGIQIIRKVAGVETVVFQIDNNGDPYIKITGLGFRQILANNADTSGVGYRALRVSN